MISSADGDEGMTSVDDLNYVMSSTAGDEGMTSVDDLNYVTSSTAGDEGMTSTMRCHQLLEMGDILSG